MLKLTFIVLEENIVFGVVLEGLKRMLLIEEGDLSLILVEMKELVVRSNGNGNGNLGVGKDENKQKSIFLVYI